MEATSEEDLQRQREEELTALQNQLSELTSHFETLELNMKKYTAGMNLCLTYWPFNLWPLTFTGIEQMEEQVRQQSTKNKEEEDAYRIKKGTYDLLPNADENIVKLKVFNGLI